MLKLCIQRRELKIADWMSMCPAAFHITIIDLFTPAWCWSQHSSGVMTPFSWFFFSNPGTSVLASLSSAPARFWVFKIMRTPSGNLLFVGIHGDFLFWKQCEDSSQYKKWVIVRERPPWQVQGWILEDNIIKPNKPVRSVWFEVQQNSCCLVWCLLLVSNHVLLSCQRRVYV